MNRLIDSHMHLSKDGVDDSWSPGFVRHLDETLELMEEQAIAMGIVAHGLPAETLDQVVTTHGSRFKGLLHVFGQDIEQSIREIERYGENPNIIGIKIYPDSFTGSDFRSAMGPVIERIKGKPWIIQVHSSPVTDSDLGIPLQIVLFSHDVDLPVVMVHSGGHQFLQLSVWLKHGVPENLYFDTSATQNLLCDSPYRPHLKWLLDLIPEDRLLWGSDYPEYPFKGALAALRALGFGDPDVARIAWKNPLRLLREHTNTDVDAADEKPPDAAS
jgi:predicted TIM-barrel fold metal-dependent hydrolase